MPNTNITALHILLSWISATVNKGNDVIFILRQGIWDRERIHNLCKITAGSRCPALNSYHATCLQWQYPSGFQHLLLSRVAKQLVPYIVNSLLSVPLGFPPKEIVTEKFYKVTEIVTKKFYIPFEGMASKAGKSKNWIGSFHNKNSSFDIHMSDT